MKDTLKATVVRDDRYPNTIKVKISGHFGTNGIQGESLPIHLGIDRIDEYTRVGLFLPCLTRTDGSNKAVAALARFRAEGVLLETVLAEQARYGRQ